MEENRYPGGLDPETSGNASNEKDKKKRRRGESFLTFVERLRDRTETEDQAESGEQPERKRRFFSKLFRRHVEEPSFLEVPAAESEAEAEDGAEEPAETEPYSSWLLGGVPEAAAPRPPETDEPPALEAESEEVAASTEVDHPEPEIELPEPVVPHEESSPEPETPEPEIPNAEITEPIEPSPAERRTVTSTDSESDDGGGRAMYTMDRTPTKTTERIIERRGANANRAVAVAAVLTGLEHVGRKRADTKLREDAAKTKEALQKEMKDRAFEANKAEKRFAKLEQAPESNYRTPEKPRNVPLPLERNDGNRITANPERQAVRSPEVTAPKIIEELTHASPETVARPEVLLQKVEVAAEKDIPIEGYYEKRAEVKDEQTSSRNGGLVAGGLFADTTTHSTSQSLQNSSGVYQGDSGKPKKDDFLHSMPYSHAIIGGFGTAVLLLAVLILLLMTR